MLNPFYGMGPEFPVWFVSSSWMGHVILFYNADYRGKCGNCTPRTYPYCLKQTLVEVCLSCHLPPGWPCGGCLASVVFRFLIY